MYCKCCGNKLDVEDRFCSFCGSPVEKTEILAHTDSELDKTEEMMQVYSQVNSLPKDSFEEEWEREERREMFTFMIFGVLIAVLIGTIIGGVAFLVQRDRSMQKGEDAFAEFEMDIANMGNHAFVGNQNQESSDFSEIVITPTLIMPSEVLAEDTSKQQIEENEWDERQQEYVIYDSDVRYLVTADLKDFSAWQIRLARNEIYARHGRMFDSPELKVYFESKSWYKPEIPAVEFNNSCLNEIELENLNFIINYENAHNLN